MKDHGRPFRLTAATILIIFIITVCFSACGMNPAGSDGTSAPGSETQTTTETATEEPTTKLTPADNLIALTFDDGPGTDSSEVILKVLEENDAKATFFVVGYNIDEYPQNVVKAFEQGHEIGNHTKGHVNLSKSTPETIHSQISYVNDRVKELTGTAPVLLRAPGGNFSGSTSRVGMPLIQWSIDTNDWRHKDKSGSSRTEEQRNAEINAIVDHVMNNVGPGDIILMHEIYNFSADVCRILIPKLAQAGYRMVTVSQMFEAYGIELEPGKVYRRAESSTAAGSNTQKVEPGNYIVNTSVSGLNLRSEANAGAAILTEIPKGTAITVTESVEGWAKTAYAGYTGWVSTAYLKAQQSTNNPA